MLTFESEMFLSNAILPRSVAIALSVVALLPESCAGALLPVAHVPDENANFYVIKNDVVLFPISYSIPKERIVRTVPPKTAFAVNDSCTSFQIKRYKYGPLQEEEYHSWLQRHRFGDTRRKGGQDCLRHYEILAAGTVPMFAGLEDIPPTVMRTLPRRQLLEAKELFSLPWVDTENGPGALPEHPHAMRTLDSLSSELLDYTATWLTTEATARRLMDTLGVMPGAKILFLPCSPIDTFPSYLTASVFHGLVSLLGDDVLDVPEYEYAYQLPPGSDADKEEKLGGLWGQGFTLGFKLPRRPHLNRANISTRIRNMEFDFIIFARMSPYEPCCYQGEFNGRGGMVPEYIADVYGRYPKHKVALLYGDDSGLDDAVIRTHLVRFGGLNRGVGFVFMRELLPYVSEGPAEETLRPVDGTVLQPGCWYKEWLDFLNRWHEPERRLLACVSRSECDNLQVEGYLKSHYFEFHAPPSDQTAMSVFCRSGYALRAALLIRRLGPDGCSVDNDCMFACQGSAEQGLLHVDSQRFFDEFGVTPQELFYTISLGCFNARLFVQSALAQERKYTAIVSADPLADNSGPFASFWQVLYLLRQGYEVLLVGLELPLDVPLPLQSYLSQHLLEFAPLRSRDTSYCRWLQDDEGRSFHYVHFDIVRDSDIIEEVMTAVSCLTSDGPSDPSVAAKLLLPSFVSVQLPNTNQASMIASKVVSQLLPQGYESFKVTRIACRSQSRGPIAAPIADLVGDIKVGTRWRSAVEVLAEPLENVQLHAKLQ